MSVSGEQSTSRKYDWISYVGCQAIIQNIFSYFLLCLYFVRRIPLCQIRNLVDNEGLTKTLTRSGFCLLTGSLWEVSFSSTLLETCLDYQCFNWILRLTHTGSHSTGDWWMSGWRFTGSTNNNNSDNPQHK